MKKLFFIGALVCFSIGNFKQARACLCGSLNADVDFFYSSFFVWEQIFPKAIIIKAKYVGIRSGYGTELKILKTFYGQPSNPDTVVAWGSDGSDCRDYLGRYYNIGDTIIVTLRNLADPTYPPYGPESSNDYWLWRCYLSHVQVKGDSVYGGGPLSFTYSSFPLSLFEDSIMRRVHNIPVGIAKVAAENNASFSLSPNPSTGLAFIKWNHVLNADIVISVCDITGRVVSRYMLDRNAANSQESFQLDLSKFRDGTYLLRVNCGNKAQTLKLIVRNAAQ